MENYGPLEGLIGTWEGNRGMDIAPESDGIEENPYYETIVFEAGGDLKNAEEQTLMVVPYRQIVKRKSNDAVFHDQCGYWLWDPATGVVMQTVSIPRAVTLLAGGTAKDEGDSVILSVKSSADDKDWGIAQSPFMQEKAKTVAFEHQITITGDRLHYFETTYLDIYGRPFDHTDENTLIKVK